MCNGTPFTVEKISPRAGTELGLLDQLASATPNELSGLLSQNNVGRLKPMHYYVILGEPDNELK